MAKLPSALKRKNEVADQAQRLRRENLARLNAGQESRGQAEPVVQQEAASVPAAAPEPEEVRQLKSRLSTSEGMLRAEGERHRQEREAWDAKFRQMQKELQTLQQHKPAARIPLQELQRFVTPQQLKEFGEEHCRLLVATVQAAAGEVTRGAVQAEVAELRAELQQQRAAMRRSQAEAPAESAVSRGWIAEQNRLFSQGYYRRRPEQWAVVQETIDRAAREGRIR
jgi:hypothetical protein